MAATTGAKGLPRKTRSAVAWLRCAALIGDIETCAAASDGASFSPSPTIITLKPWPLSSSMRAILSAGVTPARENLDPDAAAPERRYHRCRIRPQPLPNRKQVFHLAMTESDDRSLGV